MLSYSDWLDANDMNDTASAQTLYAYYVADFQRGQLDQVAATSGY